MHLCIYACIYVCTYVSTYERDDDDDADDDDWWLTATLVHNVGSMGRATSNGNEAKSKMKQPWDMPMPKSEHGW